MPKNLKETIVLFINHLHATGHYSADIVERNLRLAFISTHSMRFMGVLHQVVDILLFFETIIGNFDVIEILQREDYISISGNNTVLARK